MAVSYSLERQLSIQDIRDAPPLSAPALPVRYATIGCRQYRRPPQRFYMEAHPEDTNEYGRITCHPGSIFRGNIIIELSEPLMSLHLKLLFKAEEKIATRGKYHHQVVDVDRLFAVRTLLWGIHQEDETARSKWPILQPGRHVFPFMIEMPMVNYPVSFNHPFVACAFTLCASLERPGERPFQTQSLYVDYQPIVSLSSYGLQNQLNHQAFPPIHHEFPTSFASLQLSVDIPQRSFTFPQSEHIPIRWTIIDNKIDKDTSATRVSEGTPPILVRAKFQRCIKVTHTTRYYEDRTTISRGEATWSPILGNHIEMNLPLHAPCQPSVSQTKDVGSLPAQSNPLPPTMEYSKKFRIQYFLFLSVKFRQGTLLSASTKRQSLVIPIHIASLDQGIKPPAALVPFTHPDVMTDDSMNTKPRFLPPPSPHLNDSMLPPYDPTKPPAYRS